MDKLTKYYPSPSTCWRRFDEWTRTGIFEKIWTALLTILDELGKIDWSEAAADAWFVRAKKGGTPSRMMSPILRAIEYAKATDMKFVRSLFPGVFDVGESDCQHPIAIDTRNANALTVLQDLEPSGQISLRLLVVAKRTASEALVAPEREPKSPGR